MLSSLDDLLRRRAGLRLLRAPAFDSLVQVSDARQVRAETLQREYHELETRKTELENQIVVRQREREQLEARISELVGQINSLRDEFERIQTLRAQWIKANYEEIIFRQRRDLSDLARVVAGGRRAVPNAKKQIAVVITTTSQVTQLKMLAHSEALRKNYDLFVVAYADVNESGILEVCKESGLQLFSHNLKTLHGDEVLLVHEGGLLAQNMDAALAPERSADGQEMRDIARLVAEVRYQSDVAANVQRMLTSLSADLLILFEDNAEYLTGIWVNVADRMLIPSVILPYTIADEIEPAEAYYLNEEYWPTGDIYNRLANVALPHWRYYHRDRWLLRRRGVALVAAEALGVAPPTPWILNSSRAAAIAVESRAMHEHYAARGIPEPRLMDTGSLTDDLMHAAIAKRQELRRELGLDQDRPVLLCSIPPNQLAVPRPQCEFPDFRSIVDFWVKELISIDAWHVVLKLHPSMRADDIAHIKSFDVCISELETMSLIPLCDIYNPSVSSTIRWALACGKPVLNYDVYRYQYRDFLTEPAVLTVSSRDEFSSALRRLTSDKASLQQMTADAGAASTRWGMLDGRSMQRIVGLFDDLTERHGFPKSALS